MKLRGWLVLSVIVVLMTGVVLAHASGTANRLESPRAADSSTSTDLPSPEAQLRIKYGQPKHWRALLLNH